MRKIKFRAWDGIKIRAVDNIDFRYPKPLILDNDNPNYSNKETGQWELMQFTGLKDKNGKEIYEGDIVEYELNSPSDPQQEEVKFNNGAFYPVCEWGIKMVNCKVIGNIYENPELLNN